MQVIVAQGRVHRVTNGVHTHKCSECGAHYSIEDNKCACYQPEAGTRPFLLQCEECMFVGRMK